MAGLVGLLVLYVLSVGPYRNRFAGSTVGTAHPPDCLPERAWVVMLIALATPLDTIGDAYLFTAHMLQHLLLTLVAAPLLLAGTPGLVDA